VTPDDWFRRAFVRAFEKIPAADRTWNDKVADALLHNESFKADLLLWIEHTPDE
jgi:hypothetical protein